MFGLIYEMDASIIAKIFEIVKKKVAVVKSYNQDESTTFRTLRPDDAMLGGSEFVYDTTIASGTAGYILGNSAAKKIETGMGIVIVGWYCDAYLGPDSYVWVKVNAIKRQEVPLSLVHRMSTPRHLMLTPLQVVFARQNETLEIKIYQETGESIKGIIYPFGFVIGPAKQLLME